jgi:hypothetical protein
MPLITPYTFPLFLLSLEISSARLPAHRPWSRRQSMIRSPLSMLQSPLSNTRWS